MGQEVGKHMFSADRPISFRNQDFLNRTSFSESLATAIQNWKNKDSLIIALYGQWGSGKTSIKNMVLDTISENKKDSPLVVEYNPWQWSGQDQLAEAFFNEIAIALGKEEKGGRGKIRAAKWRAYGSFLKIGAFITTSVGSLIKWLLLFIAFVGIGNGLIITEPFKILSLVIGIVAGLLLIAIMFEWAGALSEKLATFFEKKYKVYMQSLPEIKKDISESLKELNKTILIVVDDIDRLSSNEIKFLFQLIKVNADFPNMVYLLLFQRDIIEKSLENVIAMNGSNYLEKIVQVGFNIPLIERSKLEKILFAGLDEILADKSMQKNFNDQRWGNVFIAGLRYYFQTLRDVHRFLATFSFHVSLFRNNGAFEVNPIDLIALEVLRVFESKVYTNIAESKSLLVEKSYSDKDKEKFKSAVDAIINEATKQNKDFVREIILQLFPMTEKAYGGSSYSDGFSDQWYRELRVCHPDIFGRYFHLTIPENDVSQSDIDRILSVVGNRENIVAEFQRLKKRGLLGVALDRLEAYKTQIDLKHAQPFITAIFDIGDELPETQPGFYTFGADTHAYRIIYWYLRKEKDAHVRSKILKASMLESYGLYLPIDITSSEDSKIERKKDPDSFIAHPDDIEDLKKICIVKINKAAATDVLRKHDKMIRILYCWRNWVSNEAPREWVQTLIQSNNGVITFLTALLSSSASHQMGDYVPKIHWRLSLKNIEDFISVDIVENKLRSINLNDLDDKGQRAVNAFNKALDRRRKGKSEDDWRDDDDEG